MTFPVANSVLGEEWSAMMDARMNVICADENRILVALVPVVRNGTTVELVGVFASAP